MKITDVDFQAFMAHARKLVPGFTVHDGKKDSYLMNLIYGVVWPLNPRFMEGYITTIVKHVWFPKGQIRNNPRGALEVCGHELVHAHDAFPCVRGLVFVGHLSVPSGSVRYWGLRILGSLPAVGRSGCSCGCNSHYI